MAIQQLQHGHGVSITPNDNAYIWQQLFYTYKVYTTLYVGGAGDLHVLTAGGDDITFSSVPAGTFLPVHVAKVFASGTTATSILALDITTQPTDFTGLLDTYSGAAAAYSLRQLSSTYTGSAIRVRRASDNTEQDIGFSNNELDTTSLASFCSGTDGFVTTWYDQSGNGYDATQTTASKQPQIISSGSILAKNSKPIIVGDNVDDGMTATGFTNVLQSDFDIFYVGESNGTDNNEAIGWDGSDDFFVEPNSARPGINYRIFWRNRGTTAISTRTYNNEQLLSNINLSINDLSIEINGSTIGSNTLTGTAGTFNNFFLFGNSAIASANYNFQEVIVYPFNQGINRASINTNINTYYGIY